MNTNEHPFRGVAFGGFNRQDVMNYIENATREHNGKISQLKGMVDTEEKRRKELEAKLASAEQRGTEQAERAQRAEERLLEANGERNLFSAQLTEAKTRLEALERELSDLRQQNERMAPGAAAYEGLKDRAATIELEAHNRAHSILSEAEAAADATRGQLLVWLEKVRSGYSRLREDVQATLSHASQELARSQHSLEGISGEFGEHDTALDRIMEAYQPGERPKEAPAPLPLDGPQ